MYGKPTIQQSDCYLARTLLSNLRFRIPLEPSLPRASRHRAVVCEGVAELDFRSPLCLAVIPTPAATKPTPVASPEPAPRRRRLDWKGFHFTGLEKQSAGLLM